MAIKCGSYPMISNIVSFYKWIDSEVDPDVQEMLHEDLGFIARYIAKENK